MKFSILPLLACALLCVSCRAPEAPNSGFLKSYSELKEQPDVPLNAVWIKDGVDFRSYESVLVADVDTTHLLNMDWWDKFTLAEATTDSHPSAAVRVLADYFKTQTIEALQEKEASPRYALKPSAKSLQLELALTEVVPTKVWLNSIAYVIAGAFDHGATAFEGRIRDLSTNEVLARFKDQQFGQTSLVSIADLTWYSHSEHAIEYWSQELAALLRRAPGEQIEGRTTVTLKPW
jgi:hypothetical protein